MLPSDIQSGVTTNKYDEKEKSLISKFFSNLNPALLQNFGEAVNVPDFLDKAKAVTGAATATGSGWLQINYQLPINSMAPEGGSFRRSGVQVQNNISGASAQFVSHYGGATDKFTDLNYGTNTTNDAAGTLYTKTATMQGRIYRVPIYKSVLQGFLGSPDLIIQNYMNDYKNDILRMEDRVTVASVLLDSNVSGTAVSGASQGATALTMLSLKAKLMAQGAKQVKFQMNAGIYFRLKGEQATDGQFIRNGDSRISFSQVGDGLTTGLVGYLDGSEIYINHSIANTYTVVSNNVTVLTGGSSTAIIAYDPDTIGIAQGKNELNDFRVFDDSETYKKGTIELMGTQFTGATVINPNGVAYSAFV